MKIYHTLIDPVTNTKHKIVIELNDNTIWINTDAPRDDWRFLIGLDLFDRHMSAIISDQEIIAETDDPQHHIPLFTER